MKQKLYYLFLTTLLGLFGMNAWAGDYEISSAQDLADFAAAVNGGEFEANAVLTADIDMSELGSWTAIGDWGGVSGTSSACYKGHFNGQGHTINNFTFTSTHNYYGVFGVVSTGALIENFTIHGTMNLGHKTGGVVGYTRDATPTIRNIQSDMTINVTEAATTAERPGGIVGSAVNGTTVVENCTFSGTINVGGHTGNIGGIVGYVNNNAAAIVNITNCLFDGEILNGTTADGQCGGIIGYNNSGTVTIKNCLSIGTIVASSGNDGMFIGRLNGSNTTFTNNYYVGDNVNGTSSGKSAKGSAPIEVTTNQLANGEICFLLNESVSGGTNWFQTLNDDNYPFPFNGGIHDPIYANGSFNCDMTPKEGSSTAYGNTDAANIDPHTFTDGFCSVCGAFDETYMTANEEGIFEIGTANQLKWFAVYVNTKDVAANAKQTADIALTDAWTDPIGKASVAYNGTFDGQGHKITNFEGTTDAGVGKFGLFGNINGATVKNFSIAGTLTVPEGANNGSGVVGWATSSTISNIYSTLVIEAGGNGAKHVGGVVGSAQSGANTITNCTFAGSLTVGSGSHDCFAGIVGYISSDVVTNCANYGTVEYYTENGYVGGIVGYINNDKPTVANCLSVGTVTYKGEGTASYGGAIIGRLRKEVAKAQNNYWLEGSAKASSGEKVLEAPAATEVTTEQLASGEIAYKLGTAWGQEIGVDVAPVVDGKTVVEWGDAYANPNIETAAGDAECILPSKRWGLDYSAYTWVAQGDFDFGDWNESNPNYNVIIDTPAVQGDSTFWYKPGYSVEGWNYGQDLPEFGDGRPADVYAVRYFTVEGEIPSTLYMVAPHDDAPCEYYINGVRVWAETDGWNEWEVVRLTDEQKALIKTDGTVNVFAFHVHQNWGGRYADGGLYTAGQMVIDFNNDVQALEATIALAEAQGIDAEVIEFAKAKSSYRGGMGTGLAQLRKARRLAADARTEDFTGTAPADGLIAYIYNVGAKMFLAGGNDWGTHASLNHMGAKCVLHANSSGANRYAIQTNLPNGRRGANDGLGHNGYVDCGYGDDFTTSVGWAWEFEALADGTYHIINSQNSGANIYLGMTDDERLQVDTDKAGAENAYNKWILVTPEEFEALAEQATAESPVDLGHLIHQATFSQNDFDGDDKGAANDNLNDSKWDRNAGGIWNWKGNSAGGDYMFEMCNTKDAGYVYLVQEIEGLPAGNYTVSMSGYYRDGNFESADEGNVRQLAYLFAGTEENCVPLVSIVEGSGNCPGYGRGGASGIVIPDGCHDAGKFFQVGTYTNTIDAVVGTDGKLRIGVYRNGGDDVKGGDWIVTDNWRLYYKGNPVEVTVTDAGYATFVAPGNIKTIPEGVEAFAAQTNVAGGYVHLEPVTAIPVGEAVVLKAAEGTYTVNASAFRAELGTTNDLIAATEEVTADGTQYILAKQDEGAGFAKAAPATKIAAGKGYLVITGAEVKGFYPFADDATGISTVDTIDNAVIYNVAGQRINKAQKGINIVNGKKVLF